MAIRPVPMPARTTVHPTDLRTVGRRGPVSEWVALTLLVRRIPRHRGAGRLPLGGDGVRGGC